MIKKINMADSGVEQWRSRVTRVIVGSCLLLLAVAFTDSCAQSGVMFVPMLTHGCDLIGPPCTAPTDRSTGLVCSDTLNHPVSLQ